jgi:hypothetical protein
LRFSYPDRILPVDAKEASGHEGFVVLPDRALRLAGPIGREATIADILATRERTAAACGVFRIAIVPQSGPPAHSYRGEDEFFSLLKTELGLLLGVVTRAGLEKLLEERQGVDAATQRALVQK